MTRRRKEKKWIARKVKRSCGKWNLRLPESTAQEYLARVVAEEDAEFSRIRQGLGEVVRELSGTRR
mgnify:CR=1 FL=1